MKPEFSDLAIQCWRHDWPRLGHSKLCICMQAERSAIASLINAVDELATVGPENQRKLTTLGSARPQPCTAIRLVHRNATPEFSELYVGCDGDCLTVEFTEHGLKPLADALQTWAEGGEDFCIYPRGERIKPAARDSESGEIWFWTPQTDPT
ncbi:hypothetical protein [Rosistilla oblonga]|uniref:hypothetical protein n=1 Tax=Rosistilla oblonga TaxID=2527990 RepID=UPI003A97A3E1